jgi:hypothetical protein
VRQDFIARGGGSGINIVEMNDSESSCVLCALLGWEIRVILKCLVFPLPVDTHNLVPTNLTQ